jgi:D-serine deaminase-like pyridoxal phosphate-dependent protein
MILSKYSQLDTPALLIDMDLVQANIAAMQEKADKYGVSLRPHTKTHKMPELAKLQIAAGASGITVAKVGEAEVMAAAGLSNIFIANQIVGISKLKRIRDLSRQNKLRLGVDNPVQIDQLDTVFQAEPQPIEVLIEIETGENRSGVIHEDPLRQLIKHIQSKRSVRLKGVFSHEGHTYKAKSIEDCRRLCLESQRRTLWAADIAREMGIAVDTVSIGSTPSLMHSEILPGITEIRPGTYIFMDVGQGTAIADYSRCAATVLASVISLPTAERIVLDTGAKALTLQTRSEGICATSGYGLVKNSANVRLSGMFDEHGLIHDAALRKSLAIGDKLEIIPNHICPVCNLYDSAYAVSQGNVLGEIAILGRGKTR